MVTQLSVSTSLLIPLSSGLVASLTCDMQEQRRGIITQRVLCQRCDTDDSSSLVDVFDPLLSPAQVRVGHSCAVAEIQLDIGPYRVPLKNNTARLHSARDDHDAPTLFHMKALVSQQREG